jgi:uncharacterized membrane protein
MAYVETKRTFLFPLAAVWALVQDPAELGSNFYFVERTESRGPGVARWWLKGPLAALTRTEYLDCTARIAPVGESLEWEAEGANLSMSGSIRLLSVPGGQTMADLELSIEPKGLMAPILSPMIGMQIESQLQAIVANLQQKLGV